MKNKKTFNRLLGFVIIAIIVIIAAIQTPEILLPVVVLVGIILFGAGLRFLLNLKDRLDQKGKIDYGKIPSVVIVIASVAGTILVGYMVSIPLAIVAVIVGLILAILFYCRDKRKPKSNVVKLKTRNKFHKSKFKNNSFVRTIDFYIDPFLKKFFPDTKTRNISKVAIVIVLVAVILVFVISNFAIIVKGVASVILAVYIIGWLEKKRNK